MLTFSTCSYRVGNHNDVLLNVNRSIDKDKNCYKYSCKEDNLRIIAGDWNKVIFSTVFQFFVNEYIMMLNTFHTPYYAKFLFVYGFSFHAELNSCQRP